MNTRRMKWLVAFLAVCLIAPSLVYAGDESDPEIVDNSEEDVLSFLDVTSAWFYETADEPDVLFVCLKMAEIDLTQLKQHLTVHWDCNGVGCAAMAAIGYGSDEVVQFAAGYGHGFWFQEHYQETMGTYDLETGVIVMKIPKEIIQDPQPGDVLENTYALTFQRYGFIGKMGFDRAILSSIIYLLSGKNNADFGPDDGYGREYVIQY